MEGRACEVLHLRKGGGNVLAILKGAGAQKVSTPLKGGREKFDPFLTGGWRKTFRTRDFPIL